MSGSESLVELDRSTAYNFWADKWLVIWKSSVSHSFFVMPHSGRVLTVFTRINTRVFRALQSPSFELVEFLVGARIGPSLDSTLLVRGQISYWIQTWVGVYRLLVGFGIAKGQAWRSGWRFWCEVYENLSFHRTRRRFLSLPKVKDTILTRLYDIAVLMWLTEKAAHRMILKTGPYTTKDVKPTPPWKIPILFELIQTESRQPIRYYSKDLNGHQTHFLWTKAVGFGLSTQSDDTAKRSPDGSCLRRCFQNWEFSEP
jgi:hypothetical protein